MTLSDAQLPHCPRCGGRTIAKGRICKWCRRSQQIKESTDRFVERRVRQRLRLAAGRKALEQNDG